MPDGPFDLILCRNLVFTYFDEALQRRISKQLRERLRPGGFRPGSPRSLPAGVGGFGFIAPTFQSIGERCDVTLIEMPVDKINPRIQGGFKLLVTRLPARNIRFPQNASRARHGRRA